VTVTYRVVEVQKQENSMKSPSWMSSQKYHNIPEARKVHYKIQVVMMSECHYVPKLRKVQKKVKVVLMRSIVIIQKQKSP